MLTIEQNQTQQLLWQRAKQAAHNLNHDYLMQTLSLAFPPHAIGKVVRITHMLLSNSLLLQQHVDGQDPVQAQQYYFQKFKAEFKPQLNSLLDRLVNFNISDVSEQVWQAVIHVWSAEFDASSQNYIKSISTPIAGLFVWNHNVLKMHQLATA